jgi:hypothetical protein
MMMRLAANPIVLALLVAASGVLSVAARAAEGSNPFIGDWALTIPGDHAGWLGVSDDKGALSVSLLWGGGSVLPMKDAKIEGDTLVVIRGQDRLAFKAEGDELHGTLTKVAVAGKATPAIAQAFTGKRTPPPGAAPDLANVKFGEPVALFNGKDLEGWRLVDAKAANGWSVKDGLLVNEVPPGKHYGNLRTDREFEDFNIKLETRVAKGGNSGVYLRGIYEVQVADTYGKPLDPHNMGAVYSRITPTSAAEKAPGEWQTLDITLVDRHVTVILNGTKIIDNQPVAGCTGGALWSDPFKPGPIYLQGDHTGIEYRNIVLRPVVKPAKG